MAERFDRITHCHGHELAPDLAVAHAGQSESTDLGRAIREGLEGDTSPFDE